MTFKTLFFITVFLLICRNISADARTNTLFAVDLSLSATERSVAFNIIRETTIATSPTQAIGLTLFDDTVRGYIAPAPLDQTQLARLDQAMLSAPESVRSTSNMAVGIERSIDAYHPATGANLIVFSRGIIDTESQDPRARFNEWLNLVLLPQADEQNIITTLVVLNGMQVSSEIEQAFIANASHQLILGSANAFNLPQLATLLDIPNREYAAADDTGIQDPMSMVDSNPAPLTEPDTAISSTAQGIASSTIIRIFILVLACLALLSVVFWRFKSQRSSIKNTDATATTSSTYLPLSEKPSKTMERWLTNDNGTVNTSDDTKERLDFHPKSSEQHSKHRRNNDEVNIDPWDV